MVLFNWKKIVKDTAGNKRDIFVIMRWLTFKVVPSNRKDPLYRYISKNYEGDSFLVNAAPIFYEYKNYTTSEIMQYFSLASRRSYAKYIHEGSTTLDFLYTNIEEDAINSNRLLTLEDGNIHFKYEDARRK